MNAGRRPRLQRRGVSPAGYRVIVEGTADTPLRWKVFRPWLRTVSASGIVATREAATEAANAWIRQDVEKTARGGHGCGVYRALSPGAVAGSDSTAQPRWRVSLTLRILEFVMRRHSLSAAVAAGFVVAAGLSERATAVELSPEGTGQVLIYPYYTVNRNQQTVISVVNAANVAKAVRVRFLEGYNAREVLDFNLFLSEFDVWTASVFALTDAGLSGDGAAILTADRSCTAPGKDQWTGSLGTGRPYQEFANSAFTDAHEDSGPTDVTRTREGHIELI